MCSSDSDDLYNISGFHIYRNDYNQSHTRSCYGSVVYLKNGFHCTELPYRFNFNDVEITILVINQPIPNLHIIGIYLSETKVNMPNFIDVLNHLYNMKLSNPETPAILMGDFNVNFLEKTSEQQRLTTCLIREKGYTQLIKQFTDGSNIYQCAPSCTIVRCP